MAIEIFSIATAVATVFAVGVYHIQKKNKRKSMPIVVSAVPVPNPELATAPEPTICQLMQEADTCIAAAKRLRASRKEKD